LEDSRPYLLGHQDEAVNRRTRSCFNCRSRSF